MKKVMLFIATLLFIGCGSTSKKNNNINMVDYIPSSDTTKKFFTTKDNGDTNFYEESITVNGNKINIKKDNLLNRTLTINETTIIEDDIDTNLSKVLKKSISEGDTLYTLPKITTIEDIKFEDTILGTKNI
ncbi:MAG TPA: hypothetical protein ENK88_07880, partial [Campylobacterales bacterium]|nr:hypothetical protein [Campylobacterales bacterium]